MCASYEFWNFKKKKNTEYEFFIWVQSPLHFSRERMELTNTTKKFLLGKKKKLDLLNFIYLFIFLVFIMLK